VTYFVALLSGWPVDEAAQSEGVQPETLISLLAPAACTRDFTGKYHYLTGRFLPADLLIKYNLSLPPFTGTDVCIHLKPPGSSTITTMTSSGVDQELAKNKKECSSSSSSAGEVGPTSKDED
jgi:hypothetical protein